MPDRKKTFETHVAEYDAKALSAAVNFAEHRFVTIEKDVITSTHFVKGYKSIRGACSAMSRVIEEGERFLPVGIVDLDTGELHELDLFAFVAPKSAGAVAVMLPREAAEAALNAIKASNATGPMEVAAKLIQQAIDRR